ncbi:BnaC04g24370D [Brassica napus]|uniref:BnaC04g24370D protein n=1 Tax=Brassica napus TaxID=3708 RepID=A0A078H0J0_BRANA|nr:BnaC04g24370D [Brassica napus]
MQKYSEVKRLRLLWLTCSRCCPGGGSLSHSRTPDKFATA